MEFRNQRCEFPLPPTIERLVSAPPAQIIRDGELPRSNMRREFLTEEKLMSALHQEASATWAKSALHLSRGKAEFRSSSVINRRLQRY